MPVRRSLVWAALHGLGSSIAVQAQKAATPPAVIVDTDMGAGLCADVDDAMAVIMAIQSHKAGNISLKAVITSSDAIYAPMLTRGLLDEAGLSDVPVGAFDISSETDTYTEEVAQAATKPTNFGLIGRLLHHEIGPPQMIQLLQNLSSITEAIGLPHRTEWPGAVDVAVKALQELPDGEQVTFIGIGPNYNTARLLREHGDLAQKKVRKWHMMQGTFQHANDWSWWKNTTEQNPAMGSEHWSLLTLGGLAAGQNLGDWAEHPGTGQDAEECNLSGNPLIKEAKASIALYGKDFAFPLVERAQREAAKNFTSLAKELNLDVSFGGQEVGLRVYGGLPASDNSSVGGKFYHLAVYHGGPAIPAVNVSEYEGLMVRAAFDQTTMLYGMHEAAGTLVSSGVADALSSSSELGYNQFFEDADGLGATNNFTVDSQYRQNYLILGEGKEGLVHDLIQAAIAPQVKQEVIV